jgi:hypothetical protein
MWRKLSARSHREAYDLWATHFDDPALMANRDGHRQGETRECLAGARIALTLRGGAPPGRAIGLASSPGFGGRPGDGGKE